MLTRRLKEFFIEEFFPPLWVPIIIQFWLKINLGGQIYV